MLGLLNANALNIPLASKSVQCVVTSPPYYGLRDYGIAGQLGLEQSPEEYVAKIIAVFREVKRVLRDDGTVWLNLGDSYSGSLALTTNEKALKGKQGTNGGTVGNIPNHGWGNTKPKDLLGIPWRVAFALQADGWYLRSDIIWHKPNPMPESVRDRPTKSHEYLFLLSKNAKYYYDADAVREEHKKSSVERTKRPWNGNRNTGSIDASYSDMDISRMCHPNGRNRRSVWTITTHPYKGAHFATYPPKLVEPCIKAGTSEKGCCPKCGKAWERVTAPSPEYAQILEGNRGKYHPRKDDELSEGLATAWGEVKTTNQVNVSAEYLTTGWKPSCSCDAGEPVPCIVFDPFAGSGTTLLVARQLGRHGVGLDLSFPYLHDQARVRLELDKMQAWCNA